MISRKKNLHNLVHKYLNLLILANSYIDKHGFKKLIGKTTRLIQAKLKTTTIYPNLLTKQRPGKSLHLRKWSQIDMDERLDLNAIGLYKTNIGESYTTVVTDSIGRNNLFGGVGTALIFGTLLANKRDQPLRIITRREPASADNYANLLQIYGLNLKHDLVLDFSPRSSTSPSITQHPDDLFITTSWWTTYSCLQRVDPKSIVYLIQEDERFFYPVSDLYLECEKIMQHPKIKSVVNSELLWKHFVKCGFDNIKNNGTWFEPNFDRAILPAKNLNQKKRNLFFYARPNNPRNLYRTGVNLINKALLSRIIDPEKWNIILVGSNIEAFEFDDGTIPQIMTNLTWNEYLSLISTIDIGISLMATPHPSYPPLDLASAGAVVITNGYGVKENLKAYSQNIITCKLTAEDLMEGIKKALNMINNEQLVKKNLSQSSLFRSWEECLTDVIDAYS